jgi:phosphate starvation-inducible PhoH-like protein
MVSSGCVIQSIESGGRVLTFDDNSHLRELVGEFGSHLKLIASALGVVVEARGSSIRVVAGEPSDRTETDSAENRADLAARLITELYGLVERGHGLRPADVEHAIRIVRTDPKAQLVSYFEDTVVVNVDGRSLSPRSAGQRRYVELLRTHEIVLGVGPAGTGKTYLAMAAAVAALKRGQVRRLILTRPAVEAGEKLGFLPGDLSEKVDPYLRPLYDALADMLPQDRMAKMLEKNVIEVAPLAFMRGRTLNHAFVVLDEAQNTTREQMKMFLTRLGEGSRMVITGDTTQIDLPRKRDSGLVNALDVLSRVPAVVVCRLSAEDVVRHPLVAAIVDAYDARDAELARDSGG